MTPTRRLFLGGALAASAAATAAPALAQDRAARAQAWLRGSIPAPIPGASAAVYSGDRLVWTGAVGKANIELDVAARPEHRFRLGSVAKVITASTAIRLAQQGRIDLDRPIGQLMTTLPEHHRATTLRQLLNHRGGVRHYNGRDFDFREPGGSIDARNYPDMASALAIFIADPLIAPAGTKSSYSTHGYTLAAAVMETATKQSFLTLVDAEVSKPLGLASLSPDDLALIVPNRVARYDQRADLMRDFPLVTEEIGNSDKVNAAYKWAGGGFVSTAADLARFGAAHLKPGHFTQASLDTLFTPKDPIEPEQPRLGLGWRVDQDTKGRRRWHHAGSQQGARAGLVVYPDQNLSLAMMTNLTGQPQSVNTPLAALADIFA